MLVMIAFVMAWILAVFKFLISISSPRKEQESRIVGQLLTLMDGSKSLSKPLPHIVVVASTNRYASC